MGGIGLKMQKTKVTLKRQATLPKAIRAALRINAGDALRNVVLGSKVRILKTRSVAELSRMLRRPSQASASVEAMDKAIAEGATSEPCLLLSTKISSCVF